MRARASFWCILALVATTAASAVAQQPIRWETDLQTAQQHAARSNRLVLVHFWAPWCGVCNEMERDVLSNPAVVAAITANYVPVKLNVDHHRVTAHQMGINMVPADVILTPQGQVVSAIRGRVPQQQYTTQLQLAVTNSRRAPVTPYMAQRPVSPPVAPPAVAGPGQFPPAGPGTPPGISAPVTPMFANQQPVGPPAPGGVAPPSPPVFGPTVNQPPTGLAGQGIAAPPVQPPMSAPPMGPPAGVGTPGGYADPNFAGPAPGQTPPSGPQPLQQEQGAAPLALDGCCPVELVERGTWKPGDRRWGAVHEGRTYLFAGPEQQKKFLAHYELYAPINAGNDIVLQLDQRRTVEGRRQHGVFFKNRIYLFADENSLEQFRKRPADYADAYQRAAQASLGHAYR
ncbi:MAG: thioredoxin family protein [Pirellulales bacterium]|nr:thioredoxin family protein [Pirellulales bacterium]